MGKLYLKERLKFHRYRLSTLISLPLAGEREIAFQYSSSNYTDKIKGKFIIERSSHLWLPGCSCARNLIGKTNALSNKHQPSMKASAL